MAQSILSPIQSAPGAATLTVAYTVPADTSTVISTIVVCNRSATPTSFRIAVSPDGASIADPHYLFYDTPIQGNETLMFTVGLTMDETDVLRVYNTLNTLSFNFFPVENT